MAKKYVLSLDGGGLRGVYTAAFLAHVENELKAPLINHFDLVTGTSTGSIIAPGLVAGMSAQQVLDAYKEAGPLIFPKRASVVSRLWGPGHDNKPLARWLEQFFGDKTLKEALKPVAVATFDAATGQPRVWKTDHHQQLHGGNHRLMREVALASSAAPTYLPPVLVSGHGPYLDGGIWANNPALIGIIEAHRYLGASLDEIVLLSIGTGRSPTWLQYEDVRSRGAVKWVLDIIEIIFAAQSFSNHNQAKLLLKEEHYLRIDRELARNIPLDDPSEISFLEHPGKTQGSEEFQKVKRLLDIGIYRSASNA